MEKQYRINVYACDSFDEKVIARVRMNRNLDYFDGRQYMNGGIGCHLGITRLKAGFYAGRYVLIKTTDYKNEGIRDYGHLVSDERALQEILKSNNLRLLDMYKYKKLKEMYKKEIENNEELDNEEE